jgi:hypothetical protein
MLGAWYIYATTNHFSSDDIDILKSVYQVPSPGDTEEVLSTKPLYNRKNKFFTARSLAELINSVEDEDEKTRLNGELMRVKGLYDQLSATYQEGKKTGTASSSFFK